MRDNKTITLIVLLIAGVLFGSLVGEILGTYLPFLKVYKLISWTPSADLNILKYDLNIQVKLNLAGIGGIALAFWIYRKMK
ncbi:DUF4321 domain-containing protein [Brevibacillus ginsengisoli]|uniref:DUF4321 domain-containing protein n=1 Tax=Brevibacillus ginsengisoli TaxID=363854 RepID=UPI003CECED39